MIVAMVLAKGLAMFAFSEFWNHSLERAALTRSLNLIIRDMGEFPRIVHSKQDLSDTTQAGKGVRKSQCLWESPVCAEVTGTFYLLLHL